MRGLKEGTTPEYLLHYAKYCGGLRSLGAVLVEAKLCGAAVISWCGVRAQVKNRGLLGTCSIQLTAYSEGVGVGVTWCSRPASRVHPL